MKPTPLRLTVFLPLLYLGCSGGSETNDTHDDDPVDDDTAVMTSLAISPASLTLALGQGQAVTVTGMFSNGSSQDVTSAVVWAATDSAIAGLDSSGVIRSYAIGTTELVATHTENGLEARLNVTVVPAVLTAILVSPTTATIELHESQRFTALGTYSDGNVLNVTSSLQWSTSSVSTASASLALGEEGLIVPHAVGTVTVSAEDPVTGIASDDSGTLVQLTIIPSHLETIRVTPLTASVAAGHAQAFQAFGMYADDVERELTNTVTWHSSDETVATIGAGGNATSLIAGTTEITAEDPTTNITSTDAAALNVGPPLLLSVYVSPASVSLPRLLTQQLTAYGRYTDNVDRDITDAVTWNVENGTVVSVSGTGLATATDVGSSSVSATHTVSGISSDTTSESAQITVTTPVIVSVSITAPATLVPAGADMQLSALAHYDNLTTTPVPDATWQSSVPAVASVGNAAPFVGLVRTLTVGQTTIDAVDPTSGISSAANGSSLVLTVPGGVTLTSVAIEPSAPTIRAGSTFELTAMGMFSDFTTFPVTHSSNWSSTLPTFVEVGTTDGTRGLVIGISPGTSVIDATHIVSGVSTSASGQSATVTVADFDIADLIHYGLDTGSGTVATNDAPGQPNGTINGGIWRSPGYLVGDAYKLAMPSGVTANVNANLTTTMFTNLTIAFWWRYISGSGLAYAWNTSTSFRAFTNGVAFSGFWVRNTPGGTDVVYSPNVQDGQWRHIAYVLDAAAFSARLYINGTLVGSTAYSGSISLNGLHVLGQNGSSGAEVEYDFYRVWTRALSAAEIGEAVAGAF